jgi:hypothetical protein
MSSVRPIGYRHTAGLTRTIPYVPLVSPAGELLTVIGRDGCFKRVMPLFQRAFRYTEKRATRSVVSQLHSC